MVTHDIGKFCKSDITLHVGQMIEALSALGVRWCLLRRKLRLDIARHKSGIYHNILCLARMHIDAFNGKFCARGVEILIGDFALVIAVYRVGKSSLKIIQVK